MPIKKQERESRFQLFGWVLFSACSILLIVDSVVARNPWGLAGSGFFLLGCVVFLIPFTWKKG